MELIAYSLGVFGRNRQEETSLVWQCIQTTFLGLFHKDSSAVTNNLIEIISFLFKGSQQLWILLNVAKYSHSTTVDIGPGCTAGILGYINELVNQLLVGRQTDNSTSTLTIHGITLGHRECKHGEDILWQVAELLHKATALVLLTCIVNIGNIHHNINLLALSCIFVAQLQYTIPICLRQAVASRIVSRSVDNQQQGILLGQKLLHLLCQGSQIIVLVLVKELVGSQAAALLLAQYIVGTPEPIRGQYLITNLRIVHNSVMNRTSTTCSSYGCQIALWLVVSKGQVNNGIQISWQTSNWCISNSISNRQIVKNLLHSRNAGQLLILAHNSTNGSIGNSLSTMLLDSLTASSAGTKDNINKLLTYTIGCNLRTHIYCLLYIRYIKIS